MASEVPGEQPDVCRLLVAELGVKAAVSAGDPSGPSPEHPVTARPDPRDAWRSIREEAEKERDVELLLAVNEACHGLSDGSHGAQWSRLSFTLIRELKKAVVDFGLASAYAKRILRSLLSSYLFYPYDCRVLAELILTPLQYAIWSMFWQEEAEKTAFGYRSRSHGDPVRALGADALLGRGRFVAAAAQARLPVAVLDDSREAALRAFMRIREEEKPRRGLSTIRQGPTEPFGEFIDRLKDCLDKLIENEAVKETSLRRYAIENANDDCREVLEPLSDRSVERMLEACGSIGTVSHQRSMLVSALGALRITQHSCFHCGQPGHVQRNCPAREQRPQPGPRSRQGSNGSPVGQRR